MYVHVVLVCADIVDGRDIDHQFQHLSGVVEPDSVVRAFFGFFCLLLPQMGEQCQVDNYVRIDGGQCHCPE